MVANWVRAVTLVASLGELGACTAADYSDGINGFSQAVTAAAAFGQPLAMAAQQAEQSQLLQNLPTTDSNTVKLGAGCIGVDPTGYHQGDCAVTIGASKIGDAGALPDMSSLTKYAADLSAVVADTSCATLQTDAKGIATAVNVIAAKAGDKEAAASAGPISQIVGAAACAAIDAEQLRILRTATGAANPYIQKLVPLIADAYQQYYVTALNDAEKQTFAAMASYKNAASLYQKTKSAAELQAETSSLTQTATLAAAIDKAKTSPPGPVVTKIASLHQSLTDDLKSPTVNLKRVLNDAQTFVTEATAVTSAVEALQAASAPAATKPTK